MWRTFPPVLALSGGGARGFAHIGVLETLEAHRLPVRAVVGTSMGAVIGAMYLSHGSVQTVIDLWREAIDRELVPAVRPIRSNAEGLEESPLIQVARRIRNRLVVSFVVNRRTILDGEVSFKAVEHLVPDAAIERMHPSFVAVATDLGDGSEVRLRRGSLRTALRATSAIPGVLPAVEVEGRLLVDGGVVAEVPVEAARGVGWPVVAVDVSPDLPSLERDRLVLDTMMRTQMMTASLLRERHLRRAQEVIRPEVGHATWSDWRHFEELIEAGRRAARSWLGLAAS